MDREKLAKVIADNHLLVSDGRYGLAADAILAEIKAQGYVIVEAKNASWGGQLPVGDS